MEQFVARYASPMLLGFDFDIEAGQTPAMVRSLLQRIKVAQQRRPHLRISFTVATHAASDAGQASLNAQGQQVLDAIRDGDTQGALHRMASMLGDTRALMRRAVFTVT